MAKDPVCGMDVDEKGAQFMTHLDHETYYFCSKACKAEFDLKEGIAVEGAEKGWLERTLDRLLKEPKGKPPKCH